MMMMIEMMMVMMMSECEWLIDWMRDKDSSDQQQFASNYYAKHDKNKII
jgi:hypothetical protein